MSYIVNTFGKLRNLLCIYLILENISIHLDSRGIYCHIYIVCSLDFHKTKIKTASRDIVSHFGLHRQDSNLELLGHFTIRTFAIPLVDYIVNSFGLIFVLDSLKP